MCCVADANIDLYTTNNSKNLTYLREQGLVPVPVQYIYFVLRDFGSEIWYLVAVEHALHLHEC